MIIAYYSLTGNVHRFVHRLGRPSSLYAIKGGGRGLLVEPYVLITPTTGFGQVPTTVSEFVRNNAELLRGVVASGNRNFGKVFAVAGRLLAEEYDVPLVHTFELSGTDEDVRIVNDFIERVTLS